MDKGKKEVKKGQKENRRQVRKIIEGKLKRYGRKEDKYIDMDRKEGWQDKVGWIRDRKKLAG